MENHTTRISKRLIDEMNAIRKQRLESGIDKTKMSDREITELITKHKRWKQIKEDIMQYDKDKE